MKKAHVEFVGIECLSLVVYTTANEKHTASIENTLAESIRAEIRLDVVVLLQKIQICVAATAGVNTSPLPICPVAQGMTFNCVCLQAGITWLRYLLTFGLCHNGMVSSMAYTQPCPGFKASSDPSCICYSFILQKYSRLLKH